METFFKFKARGDSLEVYLDFLKVNHPYKKYFYLPTSSTQFLNISFH